MGAAVQENLIWLLAAAALVSGLALFHRPLSALLRLLTRTGVGLGLLALLAPVGELAGIGLGVNLLNALVLALMGGPGLGLLLLLRWTLR